MTAKLSFAVILVAVAPTAALATSGTVTVRSIDASGVGAEIGMVAYRDTRQGLLIEPNLRGLPPGERGFHVHEKPDCRPGPGADGQAAAGMAAGGHYDPRNTKAHRGPHAADGHRGDLPVLIVAADGTATVPVLAPHLKARDLRGRAVMIHAGGDNYSDQPAPLGGGGARVACGVVRK
jgi:Cu-Zn family superoxide dismutase